MNLILFVHPDVTAEGEALNKILDQNIKGVRTQTIDTFNMLKSRLKESTGGDREIFILFMDSMARLNKLFTLFDLMEGKRIILILPDDSKETISRAHKFYPRYFTYINDTYYDLCDVLKKMTHKV